MEKYFECFCCKELLGIVYESRCCGKLYCQNCKIKLNDTKCSECDKKLDMQRNIFAQRMLKNIKVNCKYNCGTKLPYDKMKYHECICDKKIYTCSFDKIFNKELKNSFKGNKKEILNHLKNSHSPILLIFMENYQSFSPVLKNVKTINLYKRNSNNINSNVNEDTILDLTSSGVMDPDFLRATESEENTSIEFNENIRSLNGINDLDLNNNSNNNLQAFQRNNDNGNNNDINDINVLDFDLQENQYQAMRDYRYPRLIESDNNNFENNIYNNLRNNLYCTRNRRRIENVNQNNINSNNNSSNNINAINDENYNLEINDL